MTHDKAFDIKRRRGGSRCKHRRIHHGHTSGAHWSAYRAGREARRSRRLQAALRPLHPGERDSRHPPPGSCRGDRAGGRRSKWRRRLDPLGVDRATTGGRNRAGIRIQHSQVEARSARPRSRAGSARRDLPRGRVGDRLDRGGRSRDRPVVQDQSRREQRIRASLVVGADGRNSAVARPAAPTRRKPNQRFCYMAYFAGIAPKPDLRAGFWMLDPDVVMTSPNDDDITLVAAFVDKRRLDAFKRDREGAFRGLVRRAAGAPDLDRAERVSKLIGYVDYPLLNRRPVPRPGVALVGDAALTADPVWAIGCGWAFESATWLVDAVVPALHGIEPLGRALRRYRSRHRERLLRSRAGHRRCRAGGASSVAGSRASRSCDPGREDGAPLRAVRNPVGAGTPIPLTPALARALWVNATR